MSPVRVVTDSTAYLPAAWVDELGIEVVSLTVTESDGRSEREIDMDWPAFYARMDASRKLPTSSQPAPAEFVEVFTRAAQAGEALVGIFISSKLSGTIEGARAAAGMVRETYPEAVFEFVDSRTLAMALAFVVRKAAEAARDGGSASEVAAIAREASRRARWIVLLTGLDHLRKGGRIGGAAALVGSALQINPIITVVDGSVEVLKKVRTRRRALAEAVELFCEETARLGLDEIAIQEIKEPGEAADVITMLAGCCDARPEVYPVGPVIGLHVGPGIGIAYLTERPIWPPVGPVEE